MPNPISRAAGLAWTSAALALIACGSDPVATGPSLAKGGGSGGGSPLTVSPTELEFAIPPGGSAQITASVQYTGLITASSSDEACATVAPESVPAQKPKKSSVYVATFLVAAGGPGSCTITVRDKNGKEAAVAVVVHPPAPERIFFTSNRDGPADGPQPRELYSMNVDGTDVTRLTFLEQFAMRPQVSADGRKVVFQTITLDATTSHWWIINWDGTDLTEVPPLSPRARWVTFSPDRQRLLYEAPVALSTRIFTSDVDGSNEIQLTFDTHGGENSPLYLSAADGLKILFGRFTQIYRMNADGTDQTQLTTEDLRIHTVQIQIAVSPDHGTIAFVCQIDHSPFEICRIDVDGSNWMRLTDNTDSDANPRFTRDGRIVFVSNRDGQNEIYIMNADGTGVTNLTNHPANDGM